MDRSSGADQLPRLDLEQKGLQRLANLDRYTSEFVSSISHELRTPLTSISGYAELLMDGDAGPLTDGQRRMLGIIDRNSRRLLDLLDSLMTLSQLEAGTLSMRSDAVDVRALIERVRMGAAPLLAASPRRLDVDVDPDVGWLDGDADELERALLNLVSNAVKFTGPASRIWISAGLDGDRVVITVRDDGPGILQEDQGQLFSRFFRSRAAHDQAIQGTGLGLVIVKGIVDGHAGDVGVTSAPGVGTAVAVSLPRRRAGG